MMRSCNLGLYFSGGPIICPNFLSEGIGSLFANNNEVIATVFLDIEKAFYKVWYDGLLHKLLQMATLMAIIKIIQFFLTNRHYRVKI